VSTEKIQVHKVILSVLDFDDIGADGVKEEIENTSYANHCISPDVENIETVEVEWSDDHPLNQKTTCKEEFCRLFGGTVKRTGFAREDLIEALSIPQATGRGEAYRIIVGRSVMMDIARCWVRENMDLHDDSAEQMSSGAVQVQFRGVELVVTTDFPNALFALTKAEYENWLGVGSGEAEAGKLSCSSWARELE
jgi:hypothetical protein